jgi:hypothetical protein
MEAVLHHMGAKTEPTVRQICELYALSGSHLHCTGGGWLMGAMWCHMGDRSHAIGGRWGYMGEACTVWGPYCSGVTVWESCALYGSYVHRMGTMHTIWEPCGAISSLMGGGWVLPHVGAICNYMGAVMPVEGHMMPLAPSGAGWEQWGWGRSLEAMCTFGPIAPRVLPHWVLRGKGTLWGTMWEVDGVIWEPYEPNGAT